MRASAIKDDPGYQNYLRYRPLTATINGQQPARVFTADEERGMIVAAVLDESGIMIFEPDTKSIKKETLYGDVRIKIGNRERGITEDQGATPQGLAPIYPKYHDLPERNRCFPQTVRLDQFGGTSLQGMLAIPIEAIRERLGPPHKTDIQGKASAWWGFITGPHRWSIYEMIGHEELHIGGITTSAIWISLCVLRIPSVWRPLDCPSNWADELANADVPRKP